MAAKVEYVALYTTQRGAIMQIGNLGIATNTEGVLVPADHVKDLTAEKRLGTKPLREEKDESETKASKAGKKE